MKTMTLLLLVFLTFSLSSTAMVNDTLTSFYNGLDNNLKEARDPILKKINDVNRSCVKDKLKLATSGSKLVPETLGSIATACSFYLCYDDKKTLNDLAFEKFMETMPPEFKDKLDCIKLALKEIEPDSKVLKDFDPKAVKVAKEECTRVMTSFGMQRTLEMFEKDFEKMDKLTCRAIDEKIINKIAFTGLIVKFGSIEAGQLKSSREELKEFSAKRILDACNCVVGKV
jgi:hypothetical protein